MSETTRGGIPHDHTPEKPVRHPLNDPPEAQASQTHLYRSSGGGGESLRLRIRFSGYSIWQFREPYRWPLHEHLDYEIIVPQRGIYRCELNREEITLSRGELLIVKPGDLHADFCEREVDYFGINFRIEDTLSDASTVPLFDQRSPSSAQVVSLPPETCDAFARKMADAEDLQSISGAHIQDAVMSEFFWRLVPRLPMEALSRQFRAAFGKQDFQMRLERVFTRFLYDSLSLPQMATQLGMSVRTLSNQCQAVLQASPARLFREFKLRHAASLLRTTNRPVKEIGYLLGFANPYHFSRAFKQWAGSSPTGVRESQPNPKVAATGQLRTR